MELGGALTTWLVPILLLVGLIGVEWKRTHPAVHIVDFVRADTFTLGLLILAMGIWLVPLGWWIALPAAGIGLAIRSIASEDARAMWKGRWRARSLLVLAVVCGMMLSGFGSVSEPVGAPAWGKPLQTENADAPIWPASTQHIYFHDGAIIVVNHVRMPGSLSPYGSGTMALWYLETSGTDEARLKEAVRKLTGSDMQADLFSLDTRSTGQSHDYDGTTLPYTYKHVMLDLLGERAGAEMITVARGEWGGEVQLLTIIKLRNPVGDGPFNDDPWAAKQVDAWLAATG